MRISMADTLNGWAVEPYGQPVFTGSGGETWSDANVAVAAWLFDVECLDRRDILFAGSNGPNAVLVHTTNRGMSWDVQTFRGTGLNDLTFIDRHHGWAVGDSGLIVGTTDGGLTWTEQESGSSDYLYGVSFADTLHGWAVGGWTGGCVLHTADGGLTWEVQAYFECGDRLRVTCADSNTCWVYGRMWMTSNALIEATTDGGATWTSLRGEGQQSINAVCRQSASSMWAVGYSKSSYPSPFGTPWGLVLQSQDRGQNWTVTNGSTFVDLSKIAFVDGLHGWAVGEYGAVMYTTNSGLSWAKVNAGTDAYLTNVSFADESCGWIVGASGTVLHTTDGGASWESQGGFAADASYASVTNVGRNDCWVTVDDEIWHSDDAGETWIRQLFSSTGLLRDVFFCNDQSGWATAGAGQVFHTLNGGSDWALCTSFPGHALLGNIAFMDVNHGWIAAGDSGVYHTTDGGETWTQQMVASGFNAQGVSFADANNGLVVGNSVLRTTDGGQSWSYEAATPDLYKFGVYMLFPDMAWAVGQLGTISRFTGPSGTPDVRRGEIVPDQYSLSAFPNPFNPDTRLEFALPAAGRTRLAVYDLTGRLVHTLTDRYYGQGSYSLIFNGAALPSGTYFVRLESRGNSMAKKLLLLK